MDLLTSVSKKALKSLYKIGPEILPWQKNTPFSHNELGESSRHFRILFFVFSIHIGIFFLFCDGYKIGPRPKQTKLVVRTKNLAPAPKITISKATAPSGMLDKSTPQNIKPLLQTHRSPPPPKPKPRVTKQSPQKRPAVKKPPPKKPAAARTPTRSSQVLRKIEGKLSSSPKSPLAANNQNSGPSQEEITNRFFRRYVENIATIFQSTLTLPRSGAVKLTISVQPNGKIANITPISSESDVNLEYLLKILPNITLPTYDFQKKVEFTITFCEN